VVWADKLLTFIQLLFGIFFFASIVAFFTGVVLRPKKIFELKPCLNVRYINGSIKLVCSAYNASPVPVTNLNVRVIARARVNANTLRNIVLLNGPPAHALAEPYIPLRINAELKENGISITNVDNDKVTRMFHQRKSDSAPLSVEEIYVEISGVLVGIEQAVHLQKRYLVNDNCLYYGVYNSLNADYQYARDSGLLKRLVPPNNFINEFESNDKLLTIEKNKKYLFGYGSLVDPRSFSKSIERREWFMEDFPLASLKGYKRVWNVAMDNEKHISGYKRYKNIVGEEYPNCYVTFLNIKKSEKDLVIGTMVQVTDDELDLLKDRERNYSVLNVTESIMDSPSEAEVFTFIGTPEAEDRFKSRTSEKPAVISEGYFEMVENSYRSRGKAAYANYLSSTKKDSSLKLQKLVRVEV
jgi:hypothetical protein